MTKIAVVHYPAIHREHAAYQMARGLERIGFATSCKFTPGGGEQVEITQPPARSIVLKTWAEVAEMVAVHRTFKVKLLTPTARLPSRGTEHAAGLDLHYDDPLGLPVVFRPGERKLVSTGVAFTVPAETYGRIAPRSGMSVRGFDVGAGVIDCDYTGEVRVLLSLHASAQEQALQPGDRIAQLILEQCLMAQPVEVAELAATERGEGGYGSTGR